jgi:hypothetical protein
MMSAAVVALQACNMDQKLAQQLQQALKPIASSTEGLSSLPEQLQMVFDTAAGQVSGTGNSTPGAAAAAVNAAAAVEWLASRGLPGTSRSGSSSSSSVSLGMELSVQDCLHLLSLLGNGLSSSTAFVQELLEYVAGSLSHTGALAGIAAQLLPADVSSVMQQLQAAAVPASHSSNGGGSSSRPIIAAASAVIGSPAGQELLQPVRQEVDAVMCSLELLLAAAEQDDANQLRQGSLCTLALSTRSSPMLSQQLQVLCGAQQDGDRPAAVMEAAITVVKCVLFAPAMQQHVTAHVRTMLILPLQQLLQHHLFQGWQGVDRSAQQAAVQQLLPGDTFSSITYSHLP